MRLRINMLFLYEKCWPLLRILNDVKDYKDVNYREKENNLIGRAMLSLTIIKEQMNSVFQTTPCVEGKEQENNQQQGENK
jgi:hypothetical protein